MKSRYYLIDLENVGINGLEGIDKLTKNDKIIIFYGKQNLKLITKILLKYQNDYHIEIKELYIQGKNNLDFQIINTLGFLVGFYKEKYDYYIISNDHGMDIGIRNCIDLYTNYIKNKNVTINRKINIKGQYKINKKDIQTKQYYNLINSILSSNEIKYINKKFRTKDTILIIINLYQKHPNKKDFFYHFNKKFKLNNYSIVGSVYKYIILNKKWDLI